MAVRDHAVTEKSSKGTLVVAQSEESYLEPAGDVLRPHLPTLRGHPSLRTTLRAIKGLLGAAFTALLGPRTVSAVDVASEVE